MDKPKVKERMDYVERQLTCSHNCYFKKIGRIVGTVTILLKLL